MKPENSAGRAQPASQVNQPGGAFEVGASIDWELRRLRESPIPLQDLAVIRDCIADAHARRHEPRRNRDGSFAIDCASLLITPGPARPATKGQDE